ncbi:hypothetical protein HN51_045491 [Arachis hypogaea]
MLLVLDLKKHVGSCLDSVMLNITSQPIYSCTNNHNFELILCLMGSSLLHPCLCARGRLLVLCLDHVQNSDSGSMTLCSKARSSSLRTSPFQLLHMLLNSYKAAAPMIIVPMGSN